MPYIDFDSGASLTALGFEDLIDAANIAGVGYNGTQAMQATNGDDLAEARYPIAMNGAKEITVTLYWEPEYLTDWGLITLRARGNLAGPVECVLLYAQNGQFIIYDRTLTELYRSEASAYAVGTPMWLQFYVKGSNATDTDWDNRGHVRFSAGSSLSTLTERANLQNVRIETNHLADPAYPSAWDELEFGPQGIMDQISITYGPPEQPNPDQPGGTCCGSSGPGGAPPDLEPGDTVTTPRTIPPGGYPPEYSQCTPGGTPATASDPTDAQNPPLGLDTGTSAIPLVHMEWTLSDGSKRRYGTRAFTSGNGESVTARVLRWGDITHALADREGQIESSSTTVLLSDADYAIRAILNTEATKHVDGREVQFWIESETQRALGTNPRALGRGVIRNWKTGSDKLTVELQIGDALGYRYSAFSLDQPFPKHLISTYWAPSCPENTLNRPIPVIYGEQSDDYTYELNPARIPAGVIPCIHVGPAHTIPGLNTYYPETDIQAFVVCLGASKAIKSWFGSNLHPNGPGSVRMDPGTAGVDFFVPGNTGWRPPTDYVDVTGTDGITLRLTFVCARGPRADDAVSGSVPITVNGCFREDEGDQSGTLITDLAYVVQHFVQHECLQTYSSGTYGPVPTFPGGTPKVRTSTFDDVKAIHDARVSSGPNQPSDGYWGGFYFGERKSKREWLKELQIKSDLRLGINHHGQFIASAINDVEDTTLLDTYMADQHLVDDGALEVDPAIDELYNVMEYRWGVEPATGRISGGPGTFRHTQSITNHGERPCQDTFVVSTSFSYSTSVDVSGRRLARAQEPTPYVRFKMDLRGLLITLGGLFKLDHYEGIDGSGWEGHVLRLIKVVTDLNRFVCTLHCEDMHGYLVLDGMNPFTLDVGALDAMVLR